MEQRKKFAEIMLACRQAVARTSKIVVLSLAYRLPIARAEHLWVAYR